ncbi:hypothetical protein U0070_020346, partial [Myodes glareolus]
MVADSGYIGKNSALRMFPGALSSGQGINMAAGPQFGFWAVVHRCLQNMWARRHLGLFLFLLWMLVILCYFVNTTCIVRENQEVVACNKQSYLSKTECLKSKCCFSSSRNKMRCYAALRDNAPGAWVLCNQHDNPGISSYVLLFSLPK